MSKAFYNFQGIPFASAIGLDPEFIYLSKNFEMPLAVLVSSLDKGVNLTLILGETGVGKTTLIEYLHNNIHINFALGLIRGCSQSSQELLHNALHSFGQKDNNAGRDILLRQLLEFLNLKFDQQNQQPSLLVIDNANGMSVEALKAIELLLAFNQEKKKLLQIILVGNLELQSLLNQPELQKLANSIGITCPLEPLSEQETQEYIFHQLQAAGLAADNLPIDLQTCSEIYKYSKGLPEKVNSICNEALSENSSHHQYKIDLAQIRKIIDRKVKQNIRIVPPVTAIPATQDKRTIAFPVPNVVLLVSGLLISFLLFLVFRDTKLFTSSDDKLVVASNSSEQNPGQPIDIAPSTHITKVPEKPVSSSIIAEQQTVIKDSLQSETEKNNKRLAQTTNQPEKTQKTQVSESETDLQNSKLNELIDRANQQLAEFKLTKPKNDNALESYQTILSLAPNDQRALNGIRQIANSYLGLAKKQQNESQFDKSLSFINQGLKVSPNHKQLAQLKAQVISDQAQQRELAQKNTIVEQAPKAEIALKPTSPKKIDDQESVTAKTATEKNDNIDFAMLETQKSRTKEQLDTLLSQVNKQLKAQRLVKPAGDNAFESYQRILDIDPDNKAAKTGLKILEHNFQKLTQGALSQGKSDQAMTIVNDGLLAFPNNKALRDLRNNITLQKDKVAKEIQEKQQKKQRKLKPFANF